MPEWQAALIFRCNSGPFQPIPVLFTTFVVLLLFNVCIFRASYKFSWLLCSWTARPLAVRNTRSHSGYPHLVGWLFSESSPVNTLGLVEPEGPLDLSFVSIGFIRGRALVLEPTVCGRTGWQPASPLFAAAAISYPNIRWEPRKGCWLYIILYNYTK